MKKILTLALIVFTCTKTLAQADTLKIINVIAITSPDVVKLLSPNDTNMNKIDSIDYKVVFQINDFEKVQKVNIKIGKELDGDNYANLDLVKATINGAIYLTVGNKKYKVYGNRGFYSFSIAKNTQAMQNIKHVTVKALNTNGTFSNIKRSVF